MLGNEETVRVDDPTTPPATPATPATPAATSQPRHTTSREDQMTSTDLRVGLCATCLHVRRAGNQRGSVFYRCARAEDDPRFPKYPRLPVVNCIGYEPDVDSGAQAHGDNR